VCFYVSFFLLQTLQLFRKPALFVASSVPAEMSTTIKSEARKKGASIVTAEAAATHVIVPEKPMSEPEPDDDYLRPVKHVAPLCRAHWWYQPDSLDVWLPASHFDDDDSECPLPVDPADPFASEREAMTALATAAVHNCSASGAHFVAWHVDSIVFLSVSVSGCTSFHHPGAKTVNSWCCVSSSQSTHSGALGASYRRVGRRASVMNQSNFSLFLYLPSLFLGHVALCALCRADHTMGHGFDQVQ
jgi:hypothetical protein